MNQWWLTLNRLRLAFYRWQLMANHRLADDRMPAGTLREVRAPPPPPPPGVSGSGLGGGSRRSGSGPVQAVAKASRVSD